MGIGWIDFRAVDLCEATEGRVFGPGPASEAREPFDLEAFASRNGTTGVADIETCTCKSDRLHIPDLNPAYAIVAAMSVASLRLPLSRPTLMILMVLTKGSIVCFLVIYVTHGLYPGDNLLYA